MSGREAPADSRYGNLGRARRIWAVGAVGGHAEALDRLHGKLRERFRHGDRLVYLGNVVGPGPANVEAVDSALAMRRHALAHRAAAPGDVVFLRGRHEEMLDRFLNLHMAPDAPSVFEWMQQQGLDAILSAYGLPPREARWSAEHGAREIARFTGKVRKAQMEKPGHREYFVSLRRAAYDEDRGVLFVSAGLDPNRPLVTQGDELWWGGEGFDSISGPFGTFRRIVRGLDPQGRGSVIGEHALSLDGGEPGVVRAALLDSRGSILDTCSS